MSKDIIDINENTVKEYVKRNRPPVEIRDQLDLGYTYDKGTIELSEIRPLWDNPNEYENLEFARIKYVKSKKIWKLYWMRASGKWESYNPCSESSNLEKLLDCIDDDSFGCFRG